MALARSGAVRHSASCVSVLKSMLGAYRRRISLGFPWWFLGGLPLVVTIASELDSRRWGRIMLGAVSLDVAMVGKL